MCWPFPVILRCRGRSARTSHHTCRRCRPCMTSPSRPAAGPAGRTETSGPRPPAPRGRTSCNGDVSRYGRNPTSTHRDVRPDAALLLVAETPVAQNARAEISMTMSEIAISRLTISRPFGVRTLRLRLFLLTLVSLKFPEVFRLTSRCFGVVVLGNRPRSFSGHSILMTSAPNAPSHRVAQGPARTHLKSTTRMPARAFI